MTETITIRHNRASLEAWHNNHLVAASQNALLSSIVSPVMDYASNLDAVKMRILYKRPSGPNGKTFEMTLFERNSDMNYYAGSQSWINYRSVSC